MAGSNLSVLEVKNDLFSFYNGTIAAVYNDDVGISRTFVKVYNLSRMRL